MLHLDPELLVIDKPAGLAVQGGPGSSIWEILNMSEMGRLTSEQHNCRVIAIEILSISWCTRHI